MAVSHDYFTQLGGAERVALAMLRAFPGAELHTALVEPSTTFPGLDEATVHTSALNRIPLFRRNHRAALPLLASAVGRLHVDADVVMCSSSGWAHGVRTDGRKVVYCHNPARWLYNGRHLGNSHGLGRMALALLEGRLEAWDQRAAHSADRYLANSTATARRIRDVYGMEAEVLHPPPTLEVDGPVNPVAGLDAGFLLCVSRLLPYKNVDVAVEAMKALPDHQLVVVGDGPEASSLREAAGSNVRLLGSVDDATLRWLYAGSAGLVAASFEDFGLTPLEAALFGKPTAALRGGGYLDTIVEGDTGLFFEEPDPSSVAPVLRELFRQWWDAKRIVAHAATFSEAEWAERLREIVVEEHDAASRPAAHSTGR